MANKKIVLKQLADYFAKKGNILSVAEYKAAEDKPMRYMVAKRPFGSWHRMTSMVKSNFPELKLIVPGIRRSSDETNDQKRTLSANEAVINGADILIIGRPITESVDPAKAAEKLSNEIQ